MADLIGPSLRSCPDCIIGVGDLPTPYTYGSQLTRPHARVVTQRLGDGMPWFVGVSVRLREPIRVPTVARRSTAGCTPASRPGFADDGKDHDNRHQQQRCHVIPPLATGVAVSNTYPLTELASVHERSAAGKLRGKVVLTPVL